MKTHTSSYKDSIKNFGRQLDSKIIYTLNGESIELGGEQLNSITPHYQGGILKSVMRQLDIDSNVEIPLETILTYEFGVKVGSEYEYINFGNYIVYSSEKQEDTSSWKIVCYDKMLYSMKNYESMGITYPITVRNYISAICTHLGLTFKNASDTFANYDKEIPNELYLDSEGRSLDYTFRDVLDQLAEVTASTICINEDDDELEIRYINNTNDTIDEEYLKDINVNFGEKFGPVNTIVLSRSAGADNIYYPSVLPENPCEIKISDNLIMNDNNRDTYMPDIYNQLNGLEYYINDFSSTGITYYNLCDRYNVKIGENTYSCVMFNDEVNVTQGLEESVYTDFPEDGETDYKKADKTDRKINQTTLIVDKQNQQIQALITNVEENNEKIDALQPTEEATGIEEMYLPKSAGKDLIEFKLKGKSKQDSYTGKNLFNNAYGQTSNVYTININANNPLGSVNCYPINLLPNTQYTLKVDMNGYQKTNAWIAGICFANGDVISLLQLGSIEDITTTTFTTDSTGVVYVGHRYGFTYGTTGRMDLFLQTAKIQIEKGSSATEWEKYVGGTASPSPNYPQDIKSVGDVRNLFDVTTQSENTFIRTTGEVTTNTNWNASDYIEVKPNSTITWSAIGQTAINNNYQLAIVEYTSEKVFNVHSTVIVTNTITRTLDSNTYYVRVLYRTSYPSTSMQLEEDSKATDYIPHGNYIDVVIREKNQWALPESETANGITFTKNSNGTFNITGTATANTSFRSWIPLKKFQDNTNYTLSSSYLVNGLEFRFEEYSTVNGTWIKQYNLLSNSNLSPQTTKIQKSIGTYVRLAIYVVKGTTLNGTNVEVQLEKGAEQTTFAPYNILHNYINLTQPLPSLPNGTADELIVKDGQAKIIQNVGRVVLDGSENFGKSSSTMADVFSYSLSNGDTNGTTETISNYFTYSNQNVVGTCRKYNQYIYLIPTAYGTMTLNDFKTWLGEKYNEGNPVIVQYALTEPIEIDLGEVSIKTINGNDYLYITDPIKSDMYAKYIRQTDYNDIYYTKHETDTQINIAKDSITSSVSETYETKLEASTLINNAKNEAISRANSYSDDVLNTARTESTLYTNQKVTEEITATSERITVVEEAIRNGVPVVITETGFTFDADGLKIAKEGQEMSSLLDNDGLSVKRNTDEVLTVRSEGVSAENITVRNYFKLDPVRFEKISSTTDSTQDGLGIFYTGGDN